MSFNWESFFDILGYAVEYSEESSVKMFELGNKYVGSEQCFPVKLYYGHVISLQNKTNNIFIPQYVSLYKSTYCCPKIIALPNLIKNSIPVDFNLISVQIDYDKKLISMLNVFIMALKLSGNVFTSIQALKYYHKEINKLNKQSKNNIMPNNTFSENIHSIGIVGHKYALNDKTLNMGILDKIKEFGFKYIISSEYTRNKHNQESFFNRRKPHWDFAQDMLYSIQKMLEDNQVKGIVFITYFGCGIDAFIEEVFKNDVSNKKPYLCLTLDEHSGEAGLMTRIEAFLDMINRKGCKKNEA